jgi:hypothetical protein
MEFTESVTLCNLVHYRLFLCIKSISIFHSLVANTMMRRQVFCYFCYRNYSCPVIWPLLALLISFCICKYLSSAHIHSPNYFFVTFILYIVPSTSCTSILAYSFYFPPLVAIYLPYRALTVCSYSLTLGNILNFT